ncbi:fimbrial chaperone [Pantoea sp. y20]
MRLNVNKKTLLQALVLTIASLTSVYASAAFTLNATRYIYQEGQRNIAVQVTNNSGDLYGGQVWIDNSAAEDQGVYFTPAPAFFKAGAGQKQLIRILKISPSLPIEKESLFWLNVQEIPPKGNSEGNSLAIALNTRVKMIYRPQAIAAGREKAESLLVRDGQTLKNPTPYYFAITGVKVNGKMLQLKKSVISQLGMMAPFSEVNMGKIPEGKTEVEVLDDYGATRKYIIKE